MKTLSAPKILVTTENELGFSCKKWAGLINTWSSPKIVISTTKTRSCVKILALYKKTSSSSKTLVTFKKDFGFARKSWAGLVKSSSRLKFVVSTTKTWSCGKF